MHQNDIKIEWMQGSCMPKLKNKIQRFDIIKNNHSFWIFKRIFDLITCLFLLPFVIILTCILFFLNMFFNKGKIYFLQKRMGKDCKPFYAIKFRTMKNTTLIARRYSDPLELDRITKLGQILRKTKIDELPQVFNVLKGDMSLIGPRPDYYEHAISFIEHIPSYKSRHSIRPGISGLSQIRLGYAEGLIETKRKSKIDLFYIENASFKLDLKIAFATIMIVINGFKK
jgi:lipopolysaccharide/colanic/teichoic acid biosynthesis glycosyltransferase